MRQRKIKNLDEKLEGLSYLAVNDADENKGKWRSVLSIPESAKLFAEFGCGKGKFITGMAKIHPEACYLAFEGNMSVVYHAMQKAEDLPNVKFITKYIDLAGDYFDKGELSGVYLNFSDPWPKIKHEKRRLTAGSRLEEYVDIVRSGGFIEFRTDNDGLFDYTMNRIAELAGVKIEAVSRDLHGEMEEIAKRIDYSELTDAAFSDEAVDSQDSMQDLGITTEYEDKFSGQGKSIDFVRLKVL